MRTIYMTKTAHDDWLKRTREAHGHNMLNWPAYIRATYRSFSIVREVQMSFIEPSLPYGNTGVSEGEKPAEHSTENEGLCL